MNKRLYRSKQNRVLSGFCGGLAEYFNVDVVLIRLAYAALTIFTALIPGVIFYVLALIIVPEEY